MLNPSSKVQKNLNEEDSSGSDAGSEVSLEPETDRFGFILTNGSTAGSVGPSPGLVRQREAKWINIVENWERTMLRKSSKVKVQCRKGIPASLRAKCWPLLCGATGRMNQHVNLYESLDSQPALQSWVDIIERDLDRQFPFHEMFLSKDGHGQRGLFRVLKAYTQYQPEEGYCQAQGPVAAVLLMNMPVEEAFWCLVQISEQYLPGYYSPLLEGVLFDAAMLTWVLKKTCPAAHKHLQQHGVEPLMFATDWLMCLFTRHLPFNTLLRVWDLFFCYGVRVLLQVAVVLVRRVLGRADQRKECQGQMETLERLRGIREQVQEEDDAFIAEVCSVPLSTKDLEKRTEKELVKWKENRPSSTFDPRGRCHGYRMAWLKAQQNSEEQERKEREKGNLSVPLARSASTLSLSPSLLHRKWRKGGKGNTGDWEGGSKVVRHLSMGAKDDWKSWTNLDIKNVQGIQEEDVVSEGLKPKSEVKLAEETEQKELLEKPRIPNTLTELTEETAVLEQTEQMEMEVRISEISEKEEIQLEETDSKMLSEQIEETNSCPTKVQTVENILQPTELTSSCERGEVLDKANLSEVLEKESQKSSDQEKEFKNTNEETDKPAADDEHTTDAEANHTNAQTDAAAEVSTEEEMQIHTDSREEQVVQADMKPVEATETENVQQMQEDTLTEASETKNETSLDFETDRDVKDQNLATDTQQELKDLITETEEDPIEVKYHNKETLVETEQKAEPEEHHTQTKAETYALSETQQKADKNVAVQDDANAEITQSDSEKHTNSDTEAIIEEEKLTQSSSECIQQKQDTDLTAEAQTEAQVAAAQDTTNESAGATEAEPVQENENKLHTELQNETCGCDRTNTEKTQIQTSEESAEFVEKADASTVEEASEQITSQVTANAEEEAEKTGNVQENSKDDVFTSTEPTDDHRIDDSTQVQIKDSPFTEGNSKADNCSLEQTSGLCSSRSSGDFRMRKSSSSRGSRSTRRLSEDLFTVPQKTTQSQFSPDPPQSQPESVNTVKTAPVEAEEEAVVQQEQHPESHKRFGLFRKLRGEQPKNTKAKGTSKIQVPKILIQDFSDGTGTGKPVVEEVEEKLSSRERRRRRRERERREKEEERLKKKKEKELEKERKKPQTRGKSFQVQKEKASDVAHPAKTGSQTRRHSASFTDSYF
ncbi:ecotropic viral integration site 5 ortholog [Melanotaenia boesemani]|uniref:ecotropic viral integration site 5 ortholog n=1 Tax=Melanotaenia boesemani TaxID=1250792 RepID=UPI001C03F92C|nr:ecotropic viral integration site 5 ortholog [Melanotaenia boesemani]